ncbi:hypothetical protein ACFPN0_27455 [Kitasatospora cinereorecta]
MTMGPALLLATLTSCSEGETKAVPKLPDRICWGAFASKGITPLLPTGEEATLDTDPFSLIEGLDAATCSTYIDGNIQFQATATRRDFENEIEWSSYEKGETDPVDVGKRAIVWPGGAIGYIVCEPSKSPSAPGNYVELSINTFDAPDDKRARSAASELLKEFAEFAQRELKCA